MDDPLPPVLEPQPEQEPASESAVTSGGSGTQAAVSTGAYVLGL